MGSEGTPHSKGGPFLSHNSDSRNMFIENLLEMVLLRIVIQNKSTTYGTFQKRDFPRFYILKKNQNKFNISKYLWGLVVRYIIIYHYILYLMTKQKCFQLLSFYSHSSHSLASLSVWCFQIFSSSLTQPLRQPWQLLSTCISGPLNLTTKIKLCSCYGWSPILLLMGTHADEGGELWWFSIAGRVLLFSSMCVCVCHQSGDQTSNLPATSLPNLYEATSHWYL